MRQTILAAPKKIESREVPLPQIEPDGVLAMTLRTGICGTDVHSYYGETIFGKVFPFHIGHEVCAIVEEVGSSVKTLKKGDVVVVNPFFTCGGCTACYLGMENNCAHKTTIGLKGFGGFSEYVYVPATSAFKVQSDDYNAMSLAEPLSTVIYGLDKLRIDPTKTVLINGIGPIGMMFAQLIKSANVSQLVVTDLNQEKLRLARKLGVDLALCPKDTDDNAKLKELTEQGFDIIIDCTGSIKSMQSTVDCVDFGGQILLFGICSAESTMGIKPFQLYKKDATIFSSFALDKNSFRKAISLLENGHINTELLIDEVVPFSQLEDSIKKIADGKANGKIIIDTTR